jgi:hypothetical protein
MRLWIYMVETNRDYAKPQYIERYNEVIWEDCTRLTVSYLRRIHLWKFSAYHLGGEFLTLEKGQPEYSCPYLFSKITTHYILTNSKFDSAVLL